MKRFYFNLVIFVLLFVVILGALSIMSTIEPYNEIFAKLTNSTDYTIDQQDRIMSLVERAQQRDGTTKLIIGDSVCSQMFNDLQTDNSDFTIIGSTGGITMAGQFILAKEWLDNHPGATDVFLVVLPASLQRTFDTNAGYQCAVMPFVLTNTLQDLDANTIHIISDTYGKPFIIHPVVNALYKSPVNRKLYLNILADCTDGYKLSNPFELSDQYVVRMNELCKQKGVIFHLLPCPVSESNKEVMNQLKKDYVESKTYYVNPDYLDMIGYFPSEQAEDGVHFSGIYANRDNLNRTILQCYSNTPLLNELEL